MADQIERTIYKLEIDDSGYIRGVDNMSASTKRFSENQIASNKRLQENELQLKKQFEVVEAARKAVESYTGADIKHRNELEKNFRTEQQAYGKLTELVANVRKGYEAANKAAQDFANTSQRAANLQTQPGQRIAPGIAPVPVPQVINPAVLQNFDLGSSLADSREEFNALAESISNSEEQLSHLGESKAFTELSHIVHQGKDALTKYNEVVNLTGDSHVSLRTQIRLGREELNKLEQQGKANTKEYFELEKKVAKLTDSFNDQQQRIRILASDTKLLDFGKGAISAATSAFQTYASVSILVGGHSEELQKKTMQLFAAMQLLQSLEQLSNLTRREGVLATLAQSAAQSTYTAVVGASTGALRAFRLALVGTGIGALLVGIGLLVVKYNELREATKEAEERQRLLTEVNDEAVKSYTGQVVRLDLIKSKLNDLSIPEKERIRLAKEYNKTAEEGNKIDLKQIDNIALVNLAIDSQIAKIKERARAKAAENVITQRQEKVFLEEEAARIRAQQQTLRSTDVNLQAEREDEKRPSTQLDIDQATGQVITRVVTEQERFNDRLLTAIQNDPKLKAARAELEAALKTLGGFIDIGDLIAPDFGKDKKKIENVFAEKLKELQTKLAEVTAKSFESEGTIRKQFQASLEKEIFTINQLVKDKKLTKGQAAILINLTTQINEVQLNEALNNFNKKVTDARKKLNDEIRTLQQQNTEETIQLLQDEFERRRRLIEFNEQQELQAVQRNTDERLAALEEQRDLIGEQAYQDAKNRIVQAGEDAQTNIIIQASQDRQQLAADSFKKTLQFFQNAINEIDLIDDQDSAKEIRALSNKFLAQKITFEQFQKQLEKIEKDYAAKKRNRDLIIERGELESIEFKLTQIEDRTSAHYKELLRLRDEQAKKIAGLEAEDAVKDVTDTQTDESTQRVSTLTDYANSIGQLTDSIVQFWQQANDAEAAALDRSIALQEKRVDAAQRIALRGNVEYLKAEEDRLRELEVARENAARRQLGIDAALQASQILVGITGAIAKIATPGIGIAETIASIAVIVGALATGYGLVRNLQGNQPRLFVGTKDTGTGGKMDEKGGFQAILHPHEAVIPADRNKEYKETVAAIYDRKVPAKDMNQFVTNYTTKNLKTINDFVTNNNTIKPVPLPNYQRIKEAAEINVSHDGKIAAIMSEHSSLLRENNELQKEILKKKIHVENKIDRDGVSSMVYDFIEQKKIYSKT